MYRKTKKTIRVDTDSLEHLAMYDKILNDPMCAIVREIREKITDKIYGDEGHLISQHDRIMLIITYERKRAM